MQQQWRIMLARFPYGGTERTELIDWTASAVLWASKQRDIDGPLRLWNTNDTPVTMCRNLAVTAAAANHIDILVMVDNDMAPDMDPAKPFLPAAFEFIKSRWHKTPTIIAAPYLTAWPDYLPTMGLWRTFKDGADLKSELYTREEAAKMTGIQPCSLLGTGLIALDMRIFTGFQVGDELVKLPPPWFYYEYTDEYHVQKATTEDMAFTRDATRLFAKNGLEIGFCSWDTWSYHVKTQFVGKAFGLDILAVVKYPFGKDMPKGD